VLIDVIGCRLLVGFSEGWRRQVGVDLVENEGLDICLGLFLFPEAVELPKTLLNRGQQVAAGLPDALAVFLAQDIADVL